MMEMIGFIIFAVEEIWMPVVALETMVVYDVSYGRHQDLSGYL